VNEFNPGQFLKTTKSRTAGGSVKINPSRQWHNTPLGVFALIELLLHKVLVKIPALSASTSGRLRLGTD
jgi:hypothetical protein